MSIRKHLSWPWKLKEQFYIIPILHHITFYEPFECPQKKNKPVHLGSRESIVVSRDTVKGVPFPAVLCCVLLAAFIQHSSDCKPSHLNSNNSFGAFNDIGTSFGFPQMHWMAIIFYCLAGHSSISQCNFRMTFWFYYPTAFVTLSPSSCDLIYQFWIAEAPGANTHPHVLPAPLPWQSSGRKSRAGTASPQRWVCSRAV